jgi:predicted anti-sigma-YlaC factor YlaD
MHKYSLQSRFPITLLVVSLTAFVFPGCSIKKWALNKTAAALTQEGGTVFTGDNDPQLVADALPFALKTYESLLQSIPNNQDLLIATGKAFCMYAYAFIQVPADTLGDTRIDEKLAQYKRAKNMFLRSRGYLLRACELRHPGFNALLDADKADSALAQMTAADSTLLYWTGGAWMGAFTADKFDMKLAVDMKKPVAFMQRLLAVDEPYGDGAAHEFFISYYGSMPVSMGGSEEQARKHFSRAVELSKGLKAGPYVSLATSVDVSKQNAGEFRTLLGKALVIDVDASPANRLANIISQKKALWLLDHIDNYFLIDQPAGPEGNHPEE